MVKIRLSRVGRKKMPSYRVVVADARAPRDGDFIEIIGNYNPLTNPATIVIDEEKALKWLRRGAQPSERVARLLSNLGIIEKPAEKPTEKPTKKPSKKPAKEPVAELAEKPAEEPAAEPAEKPTKKPSKKPAKEPAEEPTTLPQEGIE